MPSTATYLSELNREQRQAVEHGIGTDDGQGPPLLVIAGAGSGKTKTLAHRVAHLIVNGADPRRILLLTFSRRAAAELARRVQRISAQVLGTRSNPVTDALTWAGTFHGIGARLLREFADRIGLASSFTIHDREDSADLMNYVRHQCGFSKTASRFPTKGTCLAIYSRAMNAEMNLDDVLRRLVPVVHRLALRVTRTFRCLCRYQAKAERARLRRPSALLGPRHERSRNCHRYPWPLRSRTGRRISGYQSPSGLDSPRPKADRPWADRGRRRRPIDLFISSGNGAQHPRLSRGVQSSRCRHRP